MAMYKHRVANPVPLLAIVNPKGGKMATKKKTTAAKSRKKTTTSKTAAVRSRSTAASFRKSNPTKRRKSTKRSVSRRTTSRKRNPSVGGEIFEFTVAGVGLGIAQPFISPLIARLLPLGQFTQPAAAAISGYGLGWLAEKVSFTKRFGRPLKILGVSAAAIGIVSPLVRGLIGGAAPAQGMNGPRFVRRGMNGIAAVSAVPPQLVPAPVPVRQDGMNGIAAVPGRYRN